MTLKSAKEFAKILFELSPILSKIPNQVVYDENEGYQLKLEGFYKDGSVTIRIAENNSDALYVINGRYETLLQVTASESLLERVIQLQADRFRYWSRVKPEDFKTIDENWLPILFDMGHVKKVESYEII